MESRVTLGQQIMSFGAEFDGEAIPQIPKQGVRNSKSSPSRNEFRKECGNSIPSSTEFPHAESISTGKGNLADELERTKLNMEMAKQAKAGLTNELLGYQAEQQPYWTAKTAFDTSWAYLIEQEGGFSLSPAQRNLIRTAVATLDPLRASLRPAFIAADRLKAAIRSIDAEIRSHESDVKLLTGKIRRHKP
jgi:hypothetical protein